MHTFCHGEVGITKYPPICELEAHHGTNVGTAYTNEPAGKTFCHYIAESKREELLKCVAKAKLFSLLMDGSTDSGNIDNELFMVLWCDIDRPDEKVHTRMNFFAVTRHEAVTGQGLFYCLEGGLRRIRAAWYYSNQSR